MLTGEVKARIITVLQELVAEHQARRVNATDEVVEQYWKVRKLKYDYPAPPKIEPIGGKGKKDKKRGGGKNQEKK